MYLPVDAPSTLCNNSLLVLYVKYSNGLSYLVNFFLQSGWSNKLKRTYEFLAMGSFLIYCCSRSLAPQGLADTLCGSPYYMAPEIIENQKYDAKVTKDRTEIKL